MKLRSNIRFDDATAQPSSGAGVRRTVAFSSASLAANASTTVDVTLEQSELVLAVATNRPALVRGYGTAAYRTADAARPPTTDPNSTGWPVVDHGVLLQCTTAVGVLGLTLAPPIVLANMDAVPARVVYFAVKNLDSVTGIVTVTLTTRRTE